MTSNIEHRMVELSLPIFSTNISQHREALSLATEAIYDEMRKNPMPMDSNVKARYVSSYGSHLNNDKFKPLIDIVLSLCKEVAKTYFKSSVKFKCCNCWGMIYERGDFTIEHRHFPATFSAIVYLDLDNNSAPIVFENQLTVVPNSGSLILFPGVVNHYVPKTEGKRIVVAMNIDNEL